MHDSEDRVEARGAATPIPVRVTDRRPRFDDSPREEAAGTAPPERRYPSFVAELEAKSRAAEAKLAEALDLLRRRESEADEFRARLRKEMEKRSRAEMEGFLRDFLDVLDSLERGVAAAAGVTDPASLREGLAQVRDQLVTLLVRQGVEPMSLVGTPFDPHLAEAVAVSSAGPGDEHHRVVEEIRKGFMLHGRVLRPAQVRVSNRETPEKEPEPPAVP
jgi:molecular chaperone GrpE